jgi:hypothetical protein
MSSSWPLQHTARTHNDMMRSLVHVAQAQLTVHRSIDVSPQCVYSLYVTQMQCIHCNSAYCAGQSLPEELLLVCCSIIHHTHCCSVCHNVAFAVDPDVAAGGTVTAVTTGRQAVVLRQLSNAAMHKSGQQQHSTPTSCTHRPDLHDLHLGMP